MAVESITKTLGSGSGIDTGALVTSLVEAQFAAKTAALTARSDKLTAQISSVAKLRSGITGFDSALSSLIAGGTLASKLVSSNEGAVKATALANVDLSKISANIAVQQLAAAQVSSTDTGIAAGTPFRTGTLTLQLGRDVVTNGTVTDFTPAGAAIDIRIDDGDATLSGIASKINAAGAGVTASVVTDGDGQRLVLRGATGAAKAFELTAADDDTDAEGTSLATLAVGRTATNTSSGTRARDAILQVDGVRYTRTSNTVEGLVPGATLTLGAVGSASLSASRPGGTLSQAVADVVATYNEMLAIVKEASDPVTGTLRGDPAVAAMARSLRTLTTAQLGTTNTVGAPKTLADLGVATARDGTLSVDARRLTTAIADFPDAVESMFTAGKGLSAAMSAIAKSATSKSFGLDAATIRYTRDLGTVAKAKDDLTGKSDATKALLTRQFASMDSRVAAYKSTQTFLQNQIDAWNRKD